MKAFHLLLLLFALGCSVVRPQETDDKSVTLLGLGVMGKALAQCYSQNGYRVHAWNRGSQRREEMKAENLEGVTVYDDLQEAVEKTDTVIVMFASEPELKTVKEVIKTAPKETWKGKTLINFASQEPFSAKELDSMLESYGMDHVGGAMIAVPETICGPASVVLTSAPERSTNAFQKVAPALQILGRLENFEGDVGYGSLLDIALILTLNFGMTGFELALLVLEKYGAPAEYQDRFVAMSVELFPVYFPHFFVVTKDSIRNRKWDESYITLKAATDTANMHADFLKKMGIVDDIYINTYAKYLKKALKAKEGEGVSTVVKQYSNDGFSFAEKMTDEL